MLRLRFFQPSLGRRDLILRKLDGQAELLAEPADPGAAVALLQYLLTEPSGAPADLTRLYPTWRDRALAGLFIREFGDRVDSESDCRACGKSFAFGFSLNDLLAAQDEAAAASGLTLDDEGHWRFGADAWIRVPTLADLAAHAGPEAVFVALSHGLDRETVESQLEVGAPVLSLDISTECAHCGAPAAMGFEIGRYLVDCLVGERPLLLRETHLIASAYGWSHEAIMALPRSDRHAYAHLIVSERGAAALRRAV